MIVLQQQRAVIVTPPRTASVSLHVALCGSNAPLWVVGPLRPQSLHSAHETPCVPHQFAAFRVFVVCRHPLARLVSMWRHVQETNWQPDCRLSFADFVRRAAAHPDDCYPAWHQTIGDITRGLEIAGELRFERLKDELLEKLGLTIALPHLNRTQHGPWRDYYDADTLAIATEWASGDMERFKYVKEQPNADPS